MTISSSTSHGATPDVRPGASAASRALPLVAAVAATAFALAQGFLPEQAQPFHRTTDHVLEALFALSLFASAAAGSALPRLGLVSWGDRFSRVAVRAYAVGQALLGVAACFTLCAGQGRAGTGVPCRPPADVGRRRARRGRRDPRQGPSEAGRPRLRCGSPPVHGDRHLGPCGGGSAVAGGGRGHASQVTSDPTEPFGDTEGRLRHRSRPLRFLVGDTGFEPVTSSV